MKRIIGIFTIVFTCMFATHAAFACDAGYYLNNNQCTECQDNHYCPGDNQIYECPAFTYDNIEEDVYPMVVGYNVHSIGDIRLVSQWNYIGYEMTNIERCVLVLSNVEVDQGRMHVYRLEYSSQTGTYSRAFSSSVLWNRANTGYYLDGTCSGTNWCRRISECTNSHPNNSHYNGSGTIHGNDCPWECDSGYGQSDGGQCLPLCGAGVTELHVGNLYFNVYANKNTTPALNIKYNDTVCYVSLATGSGTNALHIKTDSGTVYHTVN